MQYYTLCFLVVAEVSEVYHLLDGGRNVLEKLIIT